MSRFLSARLTPLNRVDVNINDIVERLYSNVDHIQSKNKARGC